MRLEKHPDTYTCWNVHNYEKTGIALPNLKQGCFQIKYKNLQIAGVIYCNVILNSSDVINELLS